MTILHNKSVIYSKYFGFIVVFFLSLFLIQDRLKIIGKPIYNFPDSDVEGTIWFIWARCEFKVLNPYAFEESTKNFVNYPVGLSTSGQVLDNLWYQFITIIASVSNCNLNLVLNLLNLMTIICFIIIPLIAFLFFTKVGVNNVLSILGSIAILTNSNLFLMTRTSITRNIFFISFLLILYIIYLLYSNKQIKKRNLFFIFFLTMIQTNLYQYHGFFFVLFTLILLLFIRLKKMISYPVLFKLVITLFTGFGLGALSSIYAILDIYRSRSEFGNDIRPWNYELIPTSRIFDFGVNINNFFGLKSENSNGWLSLLTLTIILSACYLILIRKNLPNSKLKLAEGLFFVSFFLTLLQYSIVSFSSFHFIYYKIFNVMRGISNLELITMPLLLVSSILIINSNYRSDFELKSKSYANILIIFFILFVSLIQAFPGERSTLNSFTDFNFIEQNLSPLTKNINNQSVLFHIPDTSYQGIPGRFTQILQVAHGSKIANGFKTHSRHNSVNIEPIDDSFLNRLYFEGVNLITVHWNIMTPSDQEFYELLFLNSEHYKLLENVDRSHSNSTKSLPKSTLRTGLSQYSIFIAEKS